MLNNRQQVVMAELVFDIPKNKCVGSPKGILLPSLPTRIWDSTITSSTSCERLPLHLRLLPLDPVLINVVVMLSSFLKTKQQKKMLKPQNREIPQEGF